MSRFHIIHVTCVLWACLIALPLMAASPEIQPGSWTLAILPDTQYYAESCPAIFNAQTQFLADNKTSLNIAYVLHEGDITNNNGSAQWTNASNAFRILDNAGVPYSLLPGNHDYGPDGNGSDRTSNMAGSFPVTRLAGQPTFGGVYSGEPDSPHNSYSLFSAGDTGWLVLALEFGPRDQIVDWADGILKQYPNRQAMIVTHAYMYSDDTRYDWADKGISQSWSPYIYGVEGQPGGVNDGQEMWTQLKDNPNLQFVFSGHVCNDGTGYLASEADGGNVVHQILANYQFLDSGGQGYLRLLEFMADGRTVHVRTYSPCLDASLTAPDQDFMLAMTQTPEPSSCVLGAMGLLGLGLYARRRASLRVGARVPAKRLFQPLPWHGRTRLCPTIRLRRAMKAGR